MHLKVCKKPGEIFGTKNRPNRDSVAALDQYNEEKWLHVTKIDIDVLRNLFRGRCELTIDEAALYLRHLDGLGDMALIEMFSRIKGRDRQNEVRQQNEARFLVADIKSQIWKTITEEYPVLRRSDPEDDEGITGLW